MFFIEEKFSPGGELRGLIVMRADGTFEGRLYRGCGNGDGHEHAARASDEGFEVCALTGTLAPARAILDEELGL
jgi:hypothetical protein